MRMQLITGVGRLCDIPRLIGEQVEKLETVILGSFSHTKSWRIEHSIKQHCCNLSSKLLQKILMDSIVYVKQPFHNSADFFET